METGYHVVKCAKCGSEDLRTKRENGGTYGMNKLPLGKGKTSTVAMDSTVCISCGQRRVHRQLRQGAGQDLRDLGPPVGAAVGSTVRVRG